MRRGLYLLQNIDVRVQIQRMATVILIAKPKDDMMPLNTFIDIAILELYCVSPIILMKVCHSSIIIVDRHLIYNFDNEIKGGDNQNIE